jgi:hypothetical protein
MTETHTNFRAKTLAGDEAGVLMCDMSVRALFAILLCLVKSDGGQS